jgi:hypothetical protein
MTEVKAFRIYITNYSLFKIDRLRANIKLILHKALIRSVLTYACPVWVYDKAKPDVENTRGLNLAVVELTTVQVTKQPLYHKIRKIGMICFAKSVLTEDLYTVQKKEFAIACYMGDTYT